MCCYTQEVTSHIFLNLKHAHTHQDSKIMGHHTQQDISRTIESEQCTTSRDLSRDLLEKKMLGW